MIFFIIFCPGKHYGDEQLYPVDSGPEKQAGGSLEQVALQGRFILHQFEKWTDRIWTKWRLIIYRLFLVMKIPRWEIGRSSCSLKLLAQQRWDHFQDFDLPKAAASHFRTFLGMGLPSGTRKKEW